MQSHIMTRALAPPLFRPWTNEYEDAPLVVARNQVLGVHRDCRGPWVAQALVADDERLTSFYVGLRRVFGSLDAYQIFVCGSFSRSRTTIEDGFYLVAYGQYPKQICS